ncbi:hypothetical protein DCAR_0521773 [Daucus carota subsp. sativus]|uniref:Cytochrome P450 n=1 Tax=Daucus carota subsp. sativus TaxID=79200 RepID=A0AAF0X8I6_DAUCS|nr:hypothetical protein DCAR_0521773 [Daucus carota subsp. sativus]
MDTIIITTFICILLALTLCFFLRNISKAPQKLPPGPYPLPIIGNIHKLGKHPHKSLNTLAQVYGPIIRLKLGRVTTIGSFLHQAQLNKSSKSRISPSLVVMFPTLHTVVTIINIQ